MIEPLVFPDEAARFIVLAAERLDHLYAGQGLLQHLRQIPQRSLAAAHVLFNLAAQKNHGDDGQGEDQKGQGRQPPIGVKSQGCQPDQSQAFPGTVNQNVRRGTLEGAHIVQDPGHHVAGGTAGIIPHGQRQGMAVQILANILHHHLPRGFDEIFLHEAAEPFDKGNPDNEHRHQVDQVPSLAAEHLVHQRLDQPGHGDIRTGHQQ